MEMKRIGSLLALGLVFVSVVASASPMDGCLSCDLLSPEETRALFMMNQHMGDSIAAGRALPLSSKYKDDNAVNLMEKYIQIEDLKTCDADLVQLLVAMEARLEEEQESATYKMAPFVSTLERQHIRLMGICHQEALDLLQQIRRDTQTLASRRAFIEFAGFLKKQVAETKPSPRSFSAMSLDMSEDPSLTAAERAVATMNRARDILRTPFLFNQVKSQLSPFFGAKPGSPNCPRAIQNNLIAKHQTVGQQLANSLLPLVSLSQYHPEHYTEIPEEAKKGREIFEATKRMDQLIHDNIQLSDLVALYRLMEATFEIAPRMCAP